MRLFHIIAAMSLMGLHPAFASSVAAMVNNEVITSYEVGQRQKLLGVTSGKGGGALAELIDEKIKLGAARKIGVVVKEDEVERAFGMMAERTKMSAGQLTSALNERGIEASTLKNRLRTELAWRQVVQVKYARETPAAFSQNETLSNFVLVSPSQSEGIAEYRIARIVVVADANGEASARSKANSLRAGINSCNGLKEKFKSHQDVVVFEPTTKLSKELPEVVVEALNKTPVGKATQAYQGQNGIEIGVVCEKKNFGGNATVARKNINKEDNMEKRLQEISVSYLKELKQDAIIDVKR